MRLPQYGYGMQAGARRVMKGRTVHKLTTLWRGRDESVHGDSANASVHA